MKKSSKETISAYCFLAPALLLFIVFVLGPMISIFFLSFAKYKIITPLSWTGFSNWIRIATDTRLRTVLWNTAKFVLLLTPMHMIMGLLLAVLAYNVKNKFRVSTYRTILYFPTLVATSSLAIAWTFIFTKDIGMLNYFLGAMGIKEIPWLSSSYWVYPATMVFSLWKNVGVYFLYFLVGLQGMDTSILEAASIDGANGWRKFWSIMFPMISPTIFFVMTTMLIGVVQIFDEPYLLTKGGPGDASRSISHYIFETAFQSQNYGYASAISILLFVIVLIMTLFQFKLQNKWVSYEKE